MMRRINLLLLLLAVLLLAGCTLRPTSTGSATDWSQRGAELAGLKSWEARGRIAVKTADDGGQGNMRWTQTGADSQIALRGPFGVGAYQIDWTEAALIVTGKAGDVTLSYNGPDAVERFLEDQLGWSFPARGTRYWMLGIADPRFGSALTFDDNGWLSELKQNGWVVTYDGFVAHDDRWMPRKIIMELDQVRVKLVIDEWIF